MRTCKQLSVPFARYSHLVLIAWRLQRCRSSDSGLNAEALYREINRRLYNNNNIYVYYNVLGRVWRITIYRVTLSIGDSYYNIITTTGTDRLCEPGASFVREFFAWFKGSDSRCCEMVCIPPGYFSKRSKIQENIYHLFVTAISTTWIIIFITTSLQPI